RLRGGLGIAEFSHNLLPGDTGSHKGVPSPRYTIRTIASRSMADDTANRKFKSRNQVCLRLRCGNFCPRSLRLKKRKLYSRPGPRSKSRYLPLSFFSRTT